MKNLQRIRRARGLTQTQLAAAAGCNQATISKMEKGGKNVTLDLVERVASVLQTDPAALFGLDELENRYMQAFKAASSERQRAVLLLLEGDDSPPQKK